MLMLQVVVVDEVDYNKRCSLLINELEAAGCQIPAKIDQSLYKKQKMTRTKIKNCIFMERKTMEESVFDIVSISLPHYIVKTPN